jgi:hypothetical protein
VNEQYAWKLFPGLEAPGFEYVTLQARPITPESDGLLIYWSFGGKSWSNHE